MHVCTYNVLGTQMAPIQWNGPETDDMHSGDEASQYSLQHLSVITNPPISCLYILNTCRCVVFYNPPSSVWCLIISSLWCLLLSLSLWERSWQQQSLLFILSLSSWRVIDTDSITCRCVVFYNPPSSVWCLIISSSWCLLLSLSLWERSWQQSVVYSVTEQLESDRHWQHHMQEESHWKQQDSQLCSHVDATPNLCIRPQTDVLFPSALPKHPIWTTSLHNNKEKIHL